MSVKTKNGFYDHQQLLVLLFSSVHSHRLFIHTTFVSGNILPSTLIGQHPMLLLKNSSHLWIVLTFYKQVICCSFENLALLVWLHPDVSWNVSIEHICERNCGLALIFFCSGLEDLHTVSSQSFPHMSCLLCSVNKNNSNTTFCSEFPAFLKPFSVTCDWRISCLLVPLLTTYSEKKSRTLIFQAIRASFLQLHYGCRLLWKPKHSRTNNKCQNNFIRLNSDSASCPRWRWNGVTSNAEQNRPRLVQTVNDAVFA